MMTDTVFVTSIKGDDLKYILNTESPCHGVVYGKASLILKHTVSDEEIRVTDSRKILSWRRDQCGAVELFWGSGSEYAQHAPLRLETASEAAELVSLIDAVYTASDQYGPLDSDIDKIVESLKNIEPKDPWGSEVPWAHRDWTPDDDIEEQEEYGTDEEAEYGASEDYDEDDDDEDY